MKIKSMKRVMLLAIASMMWGCYPDGPDYVDEYDLVYTNYKKDYIFPGHSNYFISDNVVKITGSAVSGGNYEYLTPYYSNLVVSKIVANMTSMGYTRVADSSQASVIIFPMGAEVTNISYYYDYYWGYYGYYYYYPYPVTTTYQTGTLMINYIDKIDRSPDDKAPVAWIAIFNGLLEGSTADFQVRLNRGIDQAFTQSPYLHQ